MSQNLAPLVREIAWSYNLTICERCSDPLGREFYIRMTKKVGWSKNVLIHQKKERKSQDRWHEDASFPDMRGLSPRNLKYMRAFAVAWPDREIVQGVLAQITWFYNCVLLDKVSEPTIRRWYAREAQEEGWSRED